MTDGTSVSHCCMLTVIDNNSEIQFMIKIKFILNLLQPLKPDIFKYGTTVRTAQHKRHNYVSNMVDEKGNGQKEHM